MSKNPGKKSFFEKIATFIVDKRSVFFFLYVVALILCVITQSWVGICEDLTTYLPADTETRKGLVIMQEELKTFGTARVMVANVTYDIAEDLAQQVEQIEGVSSVTFDNTEDHFKGADALFDVSFTGEDADEVTQNALAAVEELLSPYDVYISSTINQSLEDTLNSEMQVVFIIAVVIILAILLLTSRSYAEIPVLVMTFGAAALLNMGTNYWFGEISFVSNSVAVLLQLALAIDYAIILLHRFTEELEQHDAREACIIALSNAIPSISASSLTTVSGLLAMTFMQFKIGFDMGIVLIKAILLSMLSVFTLMPGLLMLFSKLIIRTQHREFIPKIDVWGRFVIKVRNVAVPLFAVCLVGGFILCNNCPFVYSYSTIESRRQNATQAAASRIEESFGTQNVMALLVPKGDYSSERALLDRLSLYDEINSATGLANVEAIDGYTLTDPLTPRQFAEMTDMDYETIALLYAAYAVNNGDYGSVAGGISSYTVPLMDMFFFLYAQKDSGLVELGGELGDQLDEMYTQLSAAKEQMLGENYSRMVVDLNLPLEGEETFAFLETIHEEAARFYDADDVYLIGDSTSAKDLSDSFARDNVMISVLSIIFVILVLLFTFQSVGLPILLILVIQGSIWFNFSFCTLTDTPIYFMAYLIGVAIQMGANIDYAIVISSRYSEMKKLMPPKEAICKALSLAFPTVFTSGSIMSSATFLISIISTEPSIVSMCECLCRGTLISIFLVMFFLPQILLMGDLIVEKTRFKIKVPQRTRNTSGTVFVNGRVRGHISGTVDATMHGVIRGDVSAIVETEALTQAPEEGQENETKE